MGGSIGITSVVLMLSLGNGVTGYMNDEINKSLNPLLIDIVKANDEEEVHTQQGPPNPQMQMTNEPFTDEEIERITKIDNVETVEKVLTISGKTNVVYNDDSYALSSIGTVTGSIKEEDIEAGALPSTNEEVLLTKSFAQSLTSEDTYQSLVGKTMTFFINEMNDENQPVTIEKKVVVSGIYLLAEMGPSMGAEAYVLYTTLEEAYKENNITLQPTQLNAYASSQEEVETIKSEVEKAGFISSQTASILEQVTTYVDLATYLLAGIAGISLFVSGIMILVVLYISVVERTREIGILRAIGARKKDIRRIFFSESAIIGLLSGLIAVTTAFVLSITINNVLADNFGAELIRLTPEYMLFGVGVSTLISVIAGLFPSSKAARLDPVESLRYE